MEYPIAVSARLLPTFLDPLLADGVTPRPLCALMPAVGTADLLQRTALGLLSLLCPSCKQGSRRTWELVSAGAAWSQWPTVWVCGSPAHLLPGGTEHVPSFMPQEPTESDWGWDGSEMATSCDSLLLSYFPTFSYFSGSSS